MYELIVLRKLVDYGQFNTEGHDEINIITFKGKDVPCLQSQKQKAPERGTMQEIVNKILKRDCGLSVATMVHGRIASHCMACPVCYLFGAMNNVKGEEQLSIKSKILYETSLPLPNEKGDYPEPEEFNRIARSVGETSRGIWTDQVIPPCDLISVIDIECDNPDLIKLLIWSIENTNRYGGSTRIYGKIFNRVLGVIKCDSARTSANDLANLATLNKIEQELTKFKLEKGFTNINKEEIEEIIKKSINFPEIKDMKAKPKIKPKDKGKKPKDKGKKHERKDI